MATLAGAAVALVILVDIATGQGPPVYNNYLRAREEMRPLAGPMMNTGYAPQPPMGGMYVADPKELEKEYAKSEKKEEFKDKLGHKEYEKEYEKEYVHDGNKYGEGKGTTTAPGIYDRIMKSFGR